MALRKNSLIGIELGISTQRRKKSVSRRSGLSRIQEHIDIVKGKSLKDHDDSLRRIERESHEKRPSALKVTRGFDHSSLSSSAFRSESVSIRAFSTDPLQEAFANAEPFSTEVETFDAPDYGMGLSSRAFDESGDIIRESLPEHERPYQSTAPQADISPPGRTPSNGQSPQKQQPPSPFPGDADSREPLKQPPVPKPLPDTAAAMNAFERDIDQMIQTAKKRGDSPAVRSDITEQSPSIPSELSRETSAHPHTIFEKMGKTLPFANSFNAGHVDVVKKFDQFDQELGLKEIPKPPHRNDLFLQLSAHDLGDTDIAQDLAEIDMARRASGISSGSQTETIEENQTQAESEPSILKKTE